MKKITVFCFIIIVTLALTSCFYTKAEMENVRHDAYDEGYRDGYEEGWDDGHNSGRDGGFDSGFTEGYAYGYEDALADYRIMP